MESFDSSPNYMRVTSSFDAKKENSPQGGSECDEIISLSSSTCGSAINGPYAPQLNNSGMKYRTINKKTLKNFGPVRSFRRRAKSRIIHPHVEISDETATSHHDSSVDSFEASPPHYLKATSCSKGKKTPSQASPWHSESSSHSSQSKLDHKSLQTLSRTSSTRNVRILIKKNSFKPKRSSLNYSKVSEDDAVNRATYSSTLKDSKFPEPVELHPGGPPESDKTSAMKVCRYHHCSLHGCHGTHDPVPPLKPFLYKKRRSLKKQKSMVPKTESRPGAKHSSDKTKNLKKGLTVPIVEPSNKEISGIQNGMDSYAEIYAKQDDQPFGDGYECIQESGLIEVAFGETAFPERSYQDNLNILRKYSLQEQDFGGTAFGLKGYCLRCSQNGYTDVLDTNSSAIFKNPKEQVVEDSAILNCPNEESNKDRPETPVIFDEVTSSRDCNSEEERELTTEATTAGDSKVMQVKDSETNSPTQQGGKLQFSKQRHISMWHLIHQHMSSNLAAESTNKPLQVADGENTVDGANLLLTKESSASSRDLPDSDKGIENNDSETQEIELRKIFAIKLVREAIEKILLPEVHDQTSDDQSSTGGNTPRPEIIENNQSEAFNQKNYGESDADKGEGNVSSNQKEESHIIDDASGPEIKETEKKIVSKSEKKAPKHWSNLKKWILLQRFIRELEKVRKFNPRKPQHLPLHPDPEAEKVNLRPQTVDDRKNAEEWMLDYALRQAVGQLAPTQKKKVALLVKAFETVVPPQEDPQVQFKVPRLKGDGVDDRVSILDSANQETGTKLTKKTEKLCDLNDDSGQLLEKFRSSTGKSVFSSIISNAMDDLHASKEENRRETAGNHLDLQGTHKDSNVSLQSESSSSDFITSYESRKPEDPEIENGEPFSTTRSLILDGNGKSVETENTLGPTSHPDGVNLEKIMAAPTLQGLQEDTTSDCIEAKTKDRKNHIKMWHMIYQHVVSGIVEKVGSELLDGSEDDEVEENKSPSIKSGDYGHDFSNSTDEPSQETHVSTNLRSGLTKSDALKLVKEAVDEIVLPEIQDDSSDTQSVTSEFTSDQDISERSCSEIEDGKAESQVSKTSEPPKPKNWSKLKKLILLKRSIKALEKVRKLKPQSQPFFPQTPDHEQEKIDLRRQMMDEKKKAEQWMLDYAVQHIVTKLTPARKRRVSMLVEAFEAVVPLPEM